MSSGCTTGPTLTEAKGMGGVVAQEGFDYQLWEGLVRLPSWLRNPAFEGMIFEGLEDLEARFFAPHASRHQLLERFQAKSGALTRGELTEVFETFRRFATAYPQAARVQTLVTPSLPRTLAWLARDADRVRRARPFYAPFDDVRSASDDKLRADLAGKFGTDLGTFLAGEVEICLRSLPDRSHAVAAYGAALAAAFPRLDVSQRRIDAAFEALSALARRSIGTMLSRPVLVGIIEREIASSLGVESSVPLHIRSDRSASNVDAIEIDASQFSGRDAAYPEPDVWRTMLLAPLEATAQWAREHRHVRFTLSGSYRLSTAFAIGWSFRSAIGFELDIPTRAGMWATDDRLPPGAGSLPWQLTNATRLAGDRLVATISVLRDSARDVAAAEALDLATDLFTAVLPQAIATAAEMEASAYTVKVALATNAAALGARQIDLFLVGPAAFAMGLGHRWNAVPPTQMHEFIAAERRYLPTVKLG
jgi:SMODS-associated and fused to various effectors sensor domain